MTIPNPDHLIDQARQLLLPVSGGAPRQVDIRRAISAAYYAVFHTVLAATADMVVGARDRATARYALAYRAVAHFAFRVICEETKKPQPTAKYKQFVPTAGWDGHIRAFAIASIELQLKRHNADYDPLARFTMVEATSTVDMAADAIVQFAKAAADHRKTFLTLLLFPPR